MHAFWYWERELICFVSLSYFAIVLLHIQRRVKGSLGRAGGTWSFYEGICRLHWKGSQHMKKDTMVNASERASKFGRCLVCISN
jgi:hypothetical protein